MLTVLLGSGSAAYAKPFQKKGRFAAIPTEAGNTANLEFKPIYLSGFSAAYGAIREILKEFQPDGIILADGFHTGWDPEEKKNRSR